MAEDKPTAAFVLSLLAGIFMLIDSILIITVASMLSLPVIPVSVHAFLIIILGIVGVIISIFVIIGAIFINSGEEGKVRTGGILVLIFSIISLFVAGGGFFIGFILGLIGGILALVWKSSQKQATQGQTGGQSVNV